MPGERGNLIFLWHNYYKNMANLQLDILVIPTYSVLTLGVTDASVYPTNPPVVSAPSIEIDIPGFGTTILPFVPNEINVFTSSNLGITEPGCNQPLPDGIYRLRYSVAPAYTNNVEKTIIRVDKLQEKFDNAFLQLNMMECDRALKTQSSVTLNTINFFIQGAIAAANNCAEFESNTLYAQADNMLNNFLKTNCGCSGNNYLINFY
jgi:hypothetical protein